MTFKLTCLLTGASLAALAPATLLAQTAAPAAAAEAAAPAEEGGLTDIVVTAQRKKEKLQSTPVTVTALSAQSLANQQILDLKGMASRVPNVSIGASVSHGDAVSTYIRGAGQGAGGFAFVESAVGLYVDDVVHARQMGVSLQFPDIERIEVLRGPQGVLFGRNNLTGAIKFVRVQPTDETKIRASASYGSRDFNSQRVLYSAPFADDQFSFLVTGFHTYDGNWYDAPNVDGGKKMGASEQYGARGALAFIGSDTFSSKVDFTYTHLKDDGPATIVSKLVDGDYVGYGKNMDDYMSPYAGSGKLREYMASWTNSLQTPLGELKSVTAWIQQKESLTEDVWGGMADASGNIGIGYIREANTHTRQFSQELQLSGTTGNLSYIGGLFYFNEQSTNFWIDTTGSGFSLLPTDFTYGTKSYAGFGQLTWKFAPGWSATAGIRYTHEKKEADGTMASAFSAAQVATPVGGKATFNAWTPRVEVDYQATPNAFLFASLSKGFQAGGFNGSAVANPAAFNQPFGPETVWAYEGGAKLDLFRRTLRLNMAYFYNHFDDLQTSTRVGAGIVTQNAGQAIVHGPEVEVTWAPIHAITFNASLSRTFAKYKDLLSNTTAAEQNAPKPPRISKWQWQLGADFAERFETLGVGLPGFLRFGGTVNYVSQYNADVGYRAFGVVDGQTLATAYLGWKSDDEHWTVTVSADNLFNKRFYMGGYQYNPVTQFANKPRQVRGEIAFTF